jgi:hypothetical protein
MRNFKIRFSEDNYEHYKLLMGELFNNGVVWVTMSGDKHNSHRFDDVCAKFYSTMNMDLCLHFNKYLYFNSPNSGDLILDSKDVVDMGLRVCLDAYSMGLL